jgi:DNA polymerase-3 subunit chi
VTEIRFYHLQQLTLESALPQLLERTLARGWRAVVLARSEERIESLNGLLWTYSKESFLPHGSTGDADPTSHPVWLTAVDENPNEATVLFLTDGAGSQTLSKFDLCCEIFDGGAADAVAAARTRWKQYLDESHHLTYWRQGETGGWEKQAEANQPD